MSDGERLRRALSRDGDDDLSMVRRNDVVQISLSVRPRDQGVVRDQTSEMEMNILRRVSILDQDDQSIPVFLQFVDGHAIGDVRRTNLIAVEDAKLDQKFSFETRRKFDAFQIDLMRTVNG